MGLGTQRSRLIPVPKTSPHSRVNLGLAQAKGMTFHSEGALPTVNLVKRFNRITSSTKSNRANIPVLEDIICAC